MTIKHSITLSTTEPNNEVGVIKIRQADEQTQTLEVQITENGVPKSYQRLGVYFCAKLGQTAGLGIIEQKLNPEEMTNPANGKLEYTMRAEDWQILGRQKGYFSFRKMKDEHEFIEQFTTRDFTFDVIKSVFSEGVKEVKKDGSTYVWTIEDLIRLFNEYMASGKSDWEEFVEQNREMLESVDPGGLLLSELIRSRKPAGADVPYKDVPERLDKQIGLNSDFREFEADESFMKRVFNEESERGVNVKWFGAKGDGVTDDTNAIQSAIDYCYQHSLSLFIPNQTFKTRDLIFKVDIFGEGTLLFALNCFFTNFESDGSLRYDFKKIDGIIFESDKSSYWTAAKAGQSYVDSIIQADVRRKYGQRVYIGNKTTTPNNILSNNPAEQQAGTGFWNKYYHQWQSASDIDLDNVEAVYRNLPQILDKNILSLPHGAKINCQFVGFGVGLELCGSYNIDIRGSRFLRCCVGIVTNDASTLPGELSVAAAKCTTISIAKCLFEDISFCGVYCQSLLQSAIYDNILQPVKIGVVLVHAAQNDIYNNYNEIVFTGVYVATNNAFGNDIYRNFASNSYTAYQVYSRYGANNKFSEPLSNTKFYAEISTTNCDYSSECDVETNNLAFFYQNGNSIERSMTKSSVFTTTGTGSDFDLKLHESTRKDLTYPAVKQSNRGLTFHGPEKILNIELLSQSRGVLTYFEVDINGNGKTVFVDLWDSVDKNFKSVDLRTVGTKATFRVNFLDGKKN